MVALRNTAPPAAPAGWDPIFRAVCARPGEETPVLVLADWLDDHGDSAAAAAIRDHALRLFDRYRCAVAFLDGVLAAAAVSVAPRPAHRFPLTRAAWVERVRDALRPLGVPGLTVARAAGWGGGAEVELRHPPGGFALPDGRGGRVPLPWSPTWREAAEAARLGLDALLLRLFPDEPRRAVHADGDTFDVPFWRVVPRPPRRG